MAKPRPPEPTYPVDVSFTIRGRPVTKGNHRRHGINRRTGKPVVLQSQAYLDWRDRADDQLPIIRLAIVRSAFNATVGRGDVDKAVALPILGPIVVDAVFYRVADRGDQDNYHKGLGDWLQRAGIIANDRQLRWGGGCRLDKDAARPRIEVRLHRAPISTATVSASTPQHAPDPESLADLRRLLGRALPFVEADGPSGLVHQIREALGLPAPVREAPWL